MGCSVRIWSVLVAATLALVVGSSTAHAVLTVEQQRCQTAIGREAAKYFNAKLKLIQECKNADLASPDACAAPSPVAVQRLVDVLKNGLARRCSFAPGTDDNNLARMGFPGHCPDPVPGNGFTTADLQDCLLSSHDDLISGVCGGGANLGEPCTVLADCPDQGPGTFCRGFLNVEYDSSVIGPLAGTRLACQKEVARSAGRFAAVVMKQVQKCRSDLLDCGLVGGVITCELTGIAPANCARDRPTAAAAIKVARDRAVTAITAKCTDPADVVALKLCEPDQLTVAAAAACVLDLHQDLTDNPDPAGVSDLIDHQYPTPGVCGDNRQNQVSEECDGVSDAACPGLCGAPTGFFPCLCQNIPRTRVVEHANADLDNGWTGVSHDSGIVEGGGYVADLWDCDGPGGPDTQCVVGPSCSLPPHQPCSPAPNAINAAANADTMCPGAGNFCRVTAGGATGPHCEIEFKKRCQNDSSCQTPGDRCVVIPHGAPLPLSSGGVSVCVVNEFTEDVVGTTDLVTGAGSVRLRQNSTTYTGGDQQQPCPVCGGFCSGTGGDFGPLERKLCSSDADCDSPSHCVTESICSWGPDRDRPCRPSTPDGGPTEFFGNPSRDCRMAGNLLGTIDILFNPATTAMTTRTANISCARTGWNDKVCAGGPNQHVRCTVESECPGGTCNHQCFCGAGGTSTLPASQQPNACDKACLYGPDDGASCESDADCGAPGFCHDGDCRLNPSDTDSAQEGVCTTGPADGRCSVHTFVSCDLLDGDAACQSPLCPFCEAGETCEPIQRQCFVNPTILRQGIPGVPDRTSAAIFCVASSGAPAVDSVAGLPGPGAITQPMTTIEVGF